MKTLVLAAVSILFTANAYAACPANTTATGDRVEGLPACALAPQYLNMTVALTADNAYVLPTDVRIGGDNVDNSTITMEPGTKIYGKEKAALVIMRGSKIFANGTAAKPVVFSSLERQNFRPKMWGGLVINGNAPINACATEANPISPANCEANSEGFLDNIPKFGGPNVDDNSGKLKYVRVEYAGYEVAPGNELNGITLNGVGRGTEVDYVQVHMNADDGLELFGGTVNLKHIVLTDNDDDGLDYDFGWTGKAQFVLITLSNSTEEANGIEGANFKTNKNAIPRTAPVLSNFTIISKVSNPMNLTGVFLKEGSASEFYNFLIVGEYSVAAFDLKDGDTFKFGGRVTSSGVEQTGIKMMNSIISATAGNNFSAADGDLYSVEAWFKDEGRSNNSNSVPALVGLLPSEDATALAIGKAPADSFFTPFEYVGAFSPYADEDWSAGWSVR